MNLTDYTRKLNSILLTWVLCVHISAIDAEVTCGLQLTGRIIGGEEAVQGEFPWMGILFRRVFIGDLECVHYDKSYVLCGAALITQKHLVTAGHCFLEMKYASDFMVRLGAHDLLTDEEASSDWLQDFIPESVDIHEGFVEDTLKNDIAIITLKAYTTYTPICLPVNTSDDQGFVGQIATVAGFGRTGVLDRSPLSSKLLKLAMPVVNEDDCVIASAKVNIAIDGSQICAGYYEGSKDACQGDSGGPLMLKINRVWYLIGIVSQGYMCAQPGYYGIYTRVTSFISWIEARIKY